MCCPLPGSIRLPCIHPPAQHVSSLCCRAQAISDVHRLHRPCWLYTAQASGINPCLGHQSMPPLPFHSYPCTLQVLRTTKAITKDIFMVLMERAPAGMDMDAVRAALAQVRWGVWRRQLEWAYLASAPEAFGQLGRLLLLLLQPLPEAQLGAKPGAVAVRAASQRPNCGPAAMLPQVRGVQSVEDLHVWSLTPGQQLLL